MPTPAEVDKTGAFYTFEKGATKTSGGEGFADVWYRGHFAWEYKGPNGDLPKAHQITSLDYFNCLVRQPTNLAQRWCNFRKLHYAIGLFAAEAQTIG
jgi:hypothetical protein